MALAHNTVSLNYPGSHRWFRRCSIIPHRPSNRRQGRRCAAAAYSRRPPHLDTRAPWIARQPTRSCRAKSSRPFSGRGCTTAFDGALCLNLPDGGAPDWPRRLHEQGIRGRRCLWHSSLEARLLRNSIRTPRQSRLSDVSLPIDTYRSLQEFASMLLTFQFDAPPPACESCPPL